MAGKTTSWVPFFPFVSITHSRSGASARSCLWDNGLPQSKVSVLWILIQVVSDREQMLGSWRRALRILVRPPLSGLLNVRRWSEKLESAADWVEPAALPGDWYDDFLMGSSFRYKLTNLASCCETLPTIPGLWNQQKKKETRVCANNLQSKMNKPWKGHDFWNLVSTGT